MLQCTTVSWFPAAPNPAGTKRGHKSNFSFSISEQAACFCVRKQWCGRAVKKDVDSRTDQEITHQNEATLFLAVVLFMWQLVAVLPMFGETGGRLPWDYRSFPLWIHARRTTQNEGNRDGDGWMHLLLFQKQRSLCYYTSSCKVTFVVVIRSDFDPHSLAASSHQSIAV